MFEVILDAPKDVPTF